MKKYLSLLRYEFKTILKDSMSIIMITYPLLMLFILGFLVPAILEKTTDPSSNATMLTLIIAFVMMVSMGGFVTGAILGFSLLENKDENTLINIAVSPVKVSGYATFKVAYTTVLAIIANLVMVGGIKLLASDQYIIVVGTSTIHLLDSISWGQVVLFALVASLVVPMIALVIGAIAKNKVEGFAFMKSSGLIVMLPLLSMLTTFQDWKQYLLGIIPNFWTMKALLNQIYLSMGQTNDSDLSFAMYMIIGAVYTIFIGVLSMKFFLKKQNLK